MSNKEDIVRIMKMFNNPPFIPRKFCMRGGIAVKFAKNANA